MNFSTVETFVEQHLAGLRSKPVADLLSLPEYGEEIVKIKGKDAYLCTYHDALESERHRFVVQGVQRWRWVSNKVVAQGFEISSDYSFRTLTQEELYDFT